MIPHPEGGWYAETFRVQSPDGIRPHASAIYFLLQHGERSHWHTVDAAEIWLFHSGGPIHLHLSPDGMSHQTVRLGPNLAAGERPQAIVPQGTWQAAETTGPWTLVSCIVAPAFPLRRLPPSPRATGPPASDSELRTQTQNWTEKGPLFSFQSRPTY